MTKDKIKKIIFLKKFMSTQVNSRYKAGITQQKRK
jgi:hypothetical protein